MMLMIREISSPPLLEWATKTFTGLLIIDDIMERGIYGLEVPYSNYENQVGELLMFSLVASLFTE